MRVLYHYHQLFTEIQRQNTSCINTVSFIQRNCLLQLTLIFLPFQKSLLNSHLVNYDISWQEFLKTDLFLEILKIGLFVESDLRHVAKETTNFDATKLDRRIDIERLEIFIQIVASNLKNCKKTVRNVYKLNICSNCAR